MSPTDAVLKLPFPVFQIARYAAMAGKITSESKIPQEPVGDIPELAEDAHNLADIADVQMTAPGDVEEQEAAFDAAANLITLSESLNEELKISLDKFL